MKQYDDAFMMLEATYSQNLSGIDTQLVRTAKPRRVQCISLISILLEILNPSCYALSRELKRRGTHDRAAANEAYVGKRDTYLIKQKFG
jgi:hypothetical protein